MPTPEARAGVVTVVILVGFFGAPSGVTDSTFSWGNLSHKNLPDSAMLHRNIATLQ